MGNNISRIAGKQEGGGREEDEQQQPQQQNNHNNLCTCLVNPNIQILYRYVTYLYIFNKTNRRRINILGMLNNYEDFQIEICKNKQCKIKRNQPTN